MTVYTIISHVLSFVNILLPETSEIDTKRDCPGGDSRIRAMMSASARISQRASAHAKLRRHAENCDDNVIERAGSKVDRGNDVEDHCHDDHDLKSRLTHFSFFSPFQAFFGVHTRNCFPQGQSGLRVGSASCEAEPPCIKRSRVRPAIRQDPRADRSQRPPAGRSAPEGNAPAPRSADRGRKAHCGGCPASPRSAAAAHASAG